MVLRLREMLWPWCAYIIISNVWYLIVLYPLCPSCSPGQHPVPGSLLCELHQTGAARGTISNRWILLWCLCGIWNVLSTTGPKSVSGVSVFVWWITLLCSSIHTGKKKKSQNAHWCCSSLLVQRQRIHPEQVASLSHVNNKSCRFLFQLGLNYILS